MCPVITARPWVPGRGPATHHPTTAGSAGGSRVPVGDTPMGITRIRVSEPPSVMATGTAIGGSAIGETGAVSGAAIVSGTVPGRG